MSDRVIFLDIDGVLQPTVSQERFKHLKDGSAERLIQDVRESCLWVTHSYDALFESEDFRLLLLGVYYDWDRDAIAFLKTLLQKSGARVVLSSTWRSCGLKALELFFFLHGLKDFLKGVTLLDCLYFEPEKSDLLEERRLKRESGCLLTPLKEELKSALHLEEISTRALYIYLYLILHEEITSYVILDDHDLKAEFPEHFMRTADVLTAISCTGALQWLYRKDLPAMLDTLRQRLDVNALRAEQQLSDELFFLSKLPRGPHVL